MEDQDYFGRFVYTDIFWHWLRVSCDKNIFFLVQGRHLSHEKCYDLLLGRKEEIREPCLRLLLLKYPQLKIINMPQWHIWGESFRF